MTVPTLSAFTDDQLREAYAFQVRQDYRGDMGRTGTPCHWVEADLCSACADQS